MLSASPKSVGTFDYVTAARPFILPPSPPLPQQNKQQWRILRERVVGHRGLPCAAPENTISALRAAAAAGLRWVEFDVQLSADGVPVVLHDATLDRTTDGTGLVSAQSLAALRRLDAGAWFEREEFGSSEFEGEHLPTLGEYVAECERLHLGMNVELKGDGTEAEQEAVARAAVDVLRRAGCVGVGDSAATGAAVLLSSFSEVALRAAGSSFPKALLLDREREELTMARICGGGASGYCNAVLARLRALGCCAVHCEQHQPLLRDGVFAAMMHTAGFAVHIYTVDDERDAAFLVQSCGVDAVFSNKPLATLHTL